MMARIKRNTPDRFILEESEAEYLDFASCCSGSAMEIESEALFHASAKHCRAMAAWLVAMADRIESS